MKLGINVDHVATLRQARGTLYPDPVIAALLCEHARCDLIVVHLREDRRHIRERDVAFIKEAVKIPSVFKLAKAFDESITEIRIVEIGGVDIQACGGCHVRNTSEIGSIEIFKLENKGKGRKRLYFRLKK